MLVLVPALAVLPRAAAAQSGVRVTAQATALGTRASPAAGGEAEAEVYLTQPIVSAAWSSPSRALVVAGMLNLEGWTLADGELNAGVWGEGFVDRRHPHTFLHELVATGTTSLLGIDASLAAGRGFAPFGTDDPMVRPFVKYPVNHHLAQILERWHATVALRGGPAVLEAGLFNGDEPVGPESFGEPDRFGDSWALRATLRPSAWLEAQASRAFVKSPEHVGGRGLDHRKWSVSGRAGTVLRATPVYALVEWARTDEYGGGRILYSFGSVLAEAAVAPAAWRIAGRFERTSRPEEERVGTPFRTQRPHTDENIIGATRWTGVTARVDRTLESGRLALTPFVEAGVIGVREITGSAFSPVTLYGDDRLWSFSAGVRIAAGAGHARMGRYGVALPHTAHAH